MVIRGKGMGRLAAMVFIVTVSFTGPAVCQKALGAKIDPQLLKWNPAYYKKLMGRLKDSNSTSDEFLLQKTLLKRLIYFATTKPESGMKIHVPSNQDQYLNLFSIFISWSKDKVELTKKIREVRDNMEVLENQIALMPDTAPNLLTLELQYAFYKKSLEVYQARLSAHSQAIKQAPKLMVNALSHISIDISNTRATLEKNRTAIERLETRIRTGLVEKERLILLQKNDKADRLNAQIKKLQDQRQKLLVDRLETLFLEFSYELKNKDKQAFATGNEIVKVTSSLTDCRELYNDIARLINTMETLVFGVASTFHAQTLQEIKLLLSKFYATINGPIFSINGTPISILKLFIACLVLFIGFVAGNIYKSNVNRISLANRTLTQATRTLLANLGYYAIVVIGFLTGLKVMGIDLSSFAIVAGALTVGIGFGLQNIVANFVSGIILMFERSVKIGDYIEFDEKLRGRVVDIRMRSMTINTNANIDVIVPNQDFIQHRVINWTMKDHVRRFDIPFGVAYGTDPERVKKIVIEAIRKYNYSEIHTSLTKKPCVIMEKMGDSSLNFCLRIWINGPDIMKPNATRSRFLLFIYRALSEAGIEIPFPQRDIHLRSVENEILLCLSKGTKEEDKSLSHNDTPSHDSRGLE